PNSVGFSNSNEFAKDDFYQYTTKCNNANLYIHRMKNGFIINESSEVNSYDKDYSVIKAASQEVEKMEKEAASGKIDLKFMNNKPVEDASKTKYLSDNRNCIAKSKNGINDCGLFYYIKTYPQFTQIPASI